MTGDPEWGGFIQESEILLIALQRTLGSAAPFLGISPLSSDMEMPPGICYSWGLLQSA